MTNYNKKGYSTSEIAQILGCTVSTVHNMINGHKLGAMIIDPKTPNGRRIVRITREHLQDFIKANPRRFSDAEKRTWGVDVETEPLKQKEYIDIRELPNKPTGAWAGLIETEQKKKRKQTLFRTIKYSLTAESRLRVLQRRPLSPSLRRSSMILGTRCSTIFRSRL